MSGKVCKAGHGYAGYLTECPFCVPLPKVVRPLMTRRVTNPVTPVTNPVTKHCPTCRCGKVYKSAAARQRAYRQRRGAI